MNFNLAGNLAIMFTWKCICDEEMAESDMSPFFTTVLLEISVLKEDLRHINLQSILP